MVDSPVGTAAPRRGIGIVKGRLPKVVHQDDDSITGTSALNWTTSPDPRCALYTPSSAGAQLKYSAAQSA